MQPRQRGFTLIELLVVIAIIAILVALLLPAVQQVREAARKSQCQDHLHNLAIGAMNYESSFKCLPLGVTPDHTYTTDIGGVLGTPPWGAAVNKPNWVWGAHILKFIEQGPAYDRLGVGTRRAGEAIDDWANTQQAFETPIDVFLCPSDPAPQINTDGRRVEGFTGTTLRGTATANYVGISRGNQRKAADGYEIYHGKDKQWADGGVFLHGIDVKIRDVTDGTSNTLCFGERTYSHRVGNTVVSSRAANIFVTSSRTTNIQDCSGDGDCATDAFGTIGFYGPNGATDNNHARCGLSSQHAGGAQSALLDGKVTFISENVDREVASRLCVRHDGQPVRVP